MDLLPPQDALVPLLTESLNGFAVLDSDERYIYASASLCNLLTLDKDELLGCATRHEARIAGERIVARRACCSAGRVLRSE